MLQIGLKCIGKYRVTVTLDTHFQPSAHPSVIPRDYALQNESHDKVSQCSQLLVNGFELSCQQPTLLSASPSKMHIWQCEPTASAVLSIYTSALTQMDCDNIRLVH